MTKRMVPILGMKHMNGFRCLGGSCPDTCCKGWGITVSEDNYTVIRDHLQSSDRTELFDTAIKLVEEDSPFHGLPGAHAILTMRESDGHCHFYEDDGLCGLQCSHGASSLPDVCMVYPRVFGLQGGTLEMSGYISCPETARRLLLADDGADMLKIPFDLDARILVTQDAVPEAPYHAALPTVRMILQHVLSLPGLSMEERTFLMCVFAERTRSFFSNETDVDVTGQLAAELGRMTQPDEMGAAVRFVRATTVDAGFSMRVIATVMTMLSRTENKFGEFAGNILLNYERLAGGDMDGAEDKGAHLNRLAEIYQAHRAKVERVLPADWERMTYNFLQYYVFTNWYIKSPNLVDYTQHMLLERMLIRFMLMGHPTLVEALQSVGDGPVDAETEQRVRAAYEEAAVETYYKTTRKYEHNPKFIRKISEQLESMNLQALPMSTYMLKF